MTFSFEGEDTLLGIEDILRKLGMSRSTFERIRRPQPRLKSSVRGLRIPPDEFAGLPPFPAPTLVLGRSPRWSVAVLDAWLEKAQQNNLAGVAKSS